MAFLVLHTLLGLDRILLVAYARHVSDLDYRRKC